MKHLSKMLMGLAAFGLVACSSDEPVNNGNAEGDVFASLTIQLPSAGGTRSKTTDDWRDDDYTNSDAGYEFGQGYENNVSSVFVVLVDKDMNYLKSSLSNSEASGSTEAEPTYTLSFKADELVELADQEVGVITFCNPTAELVTNVQALTAGQPFDVDMTYTINNISDITSPNNFLMVSRDMVNTEASEYEVANSNGTLIQIPSKETLLATFNSPKNAFPLGSYKVDRVVSRFDFQDVTAGKDCKYEIKDSKEENTIGYVVLDGMALINQAKEFYYLPRVSNDGLNAGATLFGREVKGNYVVSPNAQAKKDAANASTLCGNYFFPICLSDGTSLHASTFNYTPISTILNGTEDDHNKWEVSEGTDYRIWCYTTENTIPQIEKQQRGITTGVVFKGHIEIPASLNADLNAAMEAGKVIYTYNDVLYGTKEMLFAAAKAAPVSMLNSAFKAAFNIDPATATEAEIAAMKDLTEDEVDDFVAYRPDNNGVYNVYYFYYNRHNDNRDPNAMGIMEFGTVRNNVYKLAVTKISKFGRPTDDPDTPDEDPKSYFQVSCKVMPWVVRINNIEF